jgi:integrase
MAFAERRNGKLTGRWVGEVRLTRNGTDVTYKRRFPIKKDAEGYEAYIRATGEEPPHLAGPLAGDTYATVAEQWASRNREWFQARGSASGARTNTQRYQYAVDHLGHLPVTAVTTQVLEKFADKLLKTCANRTVLRYLDVVALVLSYAHDHRMLPAGKPKIPRPADEGMEREAVSQASENAICAWLVEHRPDGDACAFLVRVLAATGCRTGELWKLRPEQIENDGFTLAKAQTKTNAARWVALHPEACRKFRAMIANGSMPDQARLARNFKDAVRALEESPTLSLYSLRHARVTRLIASGANVLDVAASVGHSSLNTTKRYFHADKERLAEVAKKVPSVWEEFDQKGVVVDFDAAKKAS